MQLSGSTKLTVIWIILECYYVVSLILRLIRLILVFHCKFCTFRFILFYIISFFNSYPRLIKPDMEGGRGVIYSYMVRIIAFSSFSALILASAIFCLHFRFPFPQFRFCSSWFLPYKVKKVIISDYNITSKPFS